MKQVNYQPVALKTLRRIPVNVAQRIRAKVRAYADDPASQANNVTRLKGLNSVRLRVGDWRVIMEDGEVIEVIKIGPRGSVYEE